LWSRRHVEGGNFINSCQWEHPHGGEELKQKNERGALQSIVLPGRGRLRIEEKKTGGGKGGTKRPIRLQIKGKKNLRREKPTKNQRATVVYFEKGVVDLWKGKKKLFKKGKHNLGGGVEGSS